MRSHPVARRYAQAYFALAGDDNLEMWGDELRRARDILATPDVAGALVNPHIPKPARIQFALNILDGVAAPARNLVRLLLERRRINVLSDIAAIYDQLVEEASGRIHADVITSIALDEELQARISSALSQALHATVTVVPHVDNSIIGGLVVRFHDRIIDVSIKTRLHALRAALAADS